MPNVTDIYNYINEFAPFEKQEDWDNSGFLVGEGNKEVFKAMVALDCTSWLLDEAVKNSCQLIITHHPIIFHPLKNLTDNSLALKAAKKGVAVISAHTSYDCAENGVSQILAETLGLKNIQKSPDGLFRIGEYNKTTVKELAVSVGEVLNAKVNFCNGDKQVTKVAVCGGAGSDFIDEAKEMGADAFVTGEAGHHIFLDAIENDIGLITAGHFETETISIKPLLEKLSEKFTDVEFLLAQEKSPIEHI